MKILLLTGSPGVGKTTLAGKIAERFAGKGLRIAGITTQEIRDAESRTGFRITDLSSKEEGWLAQKDTGGGPRIGSYRVVTQELERIGAGSLERMVMERTDLAIIDEVGPMEMTSARFRKALSQVFDLDGPTIATVKLGSRYPEVEKIREKAVQLELTKDNREQVLETVIQQLNRWTGLGA